MDDSIRRLPKTTFSGRRFTRKQLEEVGEVVRQFRQLSRNELAETVCEHLEWRTAGGENRTYACLKMLEELEAHGALSLPAKQSRQVASTRKAVVPGVRSEPGETVSVPLSELMPISLEAVQGESDKALFSELIERYHYLGWRQPVGCHYRYFIVDCKDRKLGCVLFQRALPKLSCRDEWIGWQDQRYKKRLEQVVQNSRFLIFPWVRVKNLASKALSVVRHQLAEDWHARWNVRPVLVETFVDESRFAGSSYAAAGWQRIGETQAGWNRGAKAVYVLELSADARRTLCHGEVRKARKVRPNPVSQRHGSDRFVELWRDFIGIVGAVAAEHDECWQKRRRTLNTMLVMLFIFRLVFSKNRQGYQITINELWDQCRQLNVEVPQPNPPTASSMCAARQKVDANVFRQLHWQIVARLDESAQPALWCGRRLLAVDGTKMNLPRELLQEGWKTPGKNIYYPQGLLSCLYRVGDRMPLDFELLSKSDERQAALLHLRRARAGDVAVYDRGYYSFELLHQHDRRGIDCIFRIQTGSTSPFKAFIESGETEQVIDLMPGNDCARRWRQAHPGEALHPIRVRLVRYRAGDTDYFLATTLLDSGQFSIAALSDAYHGRWGIEELYKVSKRLVEIEQFHARTEHGVRQETYAHFVLLALARSFGNELEDHLNETVSPADAKWRANGKSLLVAVARNLETLMLGHWQAACDAVANILDSIGNCAQKERPGRSYPRNSKRPDERFRNANRKARSAA